MTLEVIKVNINYEIIFILLYFFELIIVYIHPNINQITIINNIFTAFYPFITIFYSLAISWVIL